MSSSGDIIFGAPWFGEDEEQLLSSVIRSGWIGKGPLVARFERELGAYLGGASVLATSSCTAALELALRIADVGAGDEVITTPFTFAATLNAIEAVGATPVLADIDPHTLCMDPSLAEERISTRTKAVMPVHFGGRAADLAAFEQLASEHDLWVVADAAHAIGGVCRGRRIGSPTSERTLTCFSFYPNKNLSSAEGGALAAADPELIGRARTISQHGLSLDAWSRYRSRQFLPSIAGEFGMKANWTDLQAAIGIPQLARLEGFLAIREWIAEIYDDGFAGTEDLRPVDRGPAGLGDRHALHLYQLVIDEPGLRDRLVGALREQGIGVAVHYIALHLHEYFRGLAHEQLGNSEWASENLLSLPIHPGISDADAGRVVAAVREALEG